MRFFIRVTRESENEWAIRVEREGAPPVLLHKRKMTRREGDAGGFPQPPSEEVSAMSGGEPHHALCATSAVNDILKVYARIVGKNPQPGDVIAFGRYLFATLISDEVWNTISIEAINESVELSLVWAEDEWELHRLPWEMMHGPKSFLAVRPQCLAITRVVMGAPASAPRLDKLKPRVMFVAGLDLNDPRIRAGTEYLGLLRRLEENGLILDSFLLRRATISQLKKELERFQPSILHFICHGWFDNTGTSYLEMTPEPPADQPARLYANNLLPLLQALPNSPEIVVLNACYSANLPTDRKLFPLSAALVQGGVPMVIGMAGRVADMACRLFTWCFYQALLQGKSVAEAAAFGRRAGITDAGTDPTRFTDWALPHIYLAEGVSSQVELDPSWSEQFRKRERCARVFQAQSVVKPAFFCDRHDLFECYRSILNDQAEHTALVIEADVYDDTVIGPQQYGKSRLLAEFAAQAVRDGHVPCLIKFADNETPPSTPVGIGRKVLDSIRFAREKMQLASPPEYEMFKLLDNSAGSAVSAVLHEDVREELRFSAPDSAQVVRAALAVDLLNLRNEARNKLDCAGLKVLVLIDDVHRFDDAARELVEKMINETGLGKMGDPVPIVFAFTSAEVGRQEYRAAVRQLKTFIESGKFYVRKEYLRAFLPPADDGLLYHQFLLNQDPRPLIISQNADANDVKEMFDEFHVTTKGVPSRLNSEGLESAIRMAKRFGVLEEATDDDVLRQQV
jgi:hypothetical protein